MEKRSNSFGVMFYVKKHRISQGKAPIYVRITVTVKAPRYQQKDLIDKKNRNNDKGLTR